MQIRFSFVLVNDQEKALQFYTKILGFRKMADLAFGDMRWLSVVSKEKDGGVELVLEPINFPPAKTYQKALYKAGMPATSFQTNDIQKEFNKLKKHGVTFKGEPENFGLITSVLFDDTCGNWINLVQANS
ncbi:MAG: VOC family protein [Candidatus Margulisbacteria bacterium]|nr:VOC family protein [Candidatus Margulisiibacteriota bacterium]